MISRLPKAKANNLMINQYFWDDDAASCQPSVKALAHSLETAEKKRPMKELHNIWPTETSKVSGRWNPCSASAQALWTPSLITTPDFHSALELRNMGLPKPSKVARRAPSKARESLNDCVLAQAMPSKAYITRVYLKVTAGTHLGHPLLFLTLGAATSLLRGHTSVTLAAVYMESNTTKVCLIASFRHFLATGNKRKNPTDHLVSQLSPKHPYLFFSSQLQEKLQVGTKTCTK